MKKFFLFLAAMAATMTVRAAVVLDETFDQTEFPGTQTETGWTQGGTLTSGTGRTIAATPLTYNNNDKTYVLSGVGKALNSNYSDGTGYLATKPFTKQQGAGNVVYLSFLYKADGSQTQANCQVFGMSGSATGAAVRLWVGRQTDGTGSPYRMGITRVSGKGAEVQWSSATYTVDDVHLIVIKYDFSTTTATLYVDPEVGGTEPQTPDAFDSSVGDAKTSLSYLCFYTTGSNKTNFTVGGVRVSTTWAEAVEEKAPEEDPTYENSLYANFGDEATWTNTVTTQPSYGTFPTATVNNYQFAAACVVKSGKTYYFDTDSVDYIKFYSRAVVDRSTYGGAIETPWLSHIDNLYLWASSGSESKDVKIQYRVANGLWKDLSTFTNMKNPALYTIPVNKDQIKLRISNTTTSTQFFYYIGDKHPRDIVTLPLDKAGFTSFSWEFNYSVDGADAYMVSWTGANAISLTKVTGTIPAGAGVVLYNAEGGTAKIRTKDATAATADMSGNKLVGAPAGATIATDAAYLLARMNNETAFYLYGGNDGYNLPARKAYLPAPEPAPVAAPERLEITIHEGMQTALQNTTVETKAAKVMIDGMMFIRKAGELFTLTGARVK